MRHSVIELDREGGDLGNSSSINKLKVTSMVELVVAGDFSSRSSPPMPTPTKTSSSCSPPFLLYQSVQLIASGSPDAAGLGQLQAFQSGPDTFGFGFLGLLDLGLKA